jgi:uncharacterized protein (TIGR00661 family)
MRKPRILYAIQGTGNGHVARARDIVPRLAQKAEIDILMSGIQADVNLPFPVKYRFKGMSFIFGQHGGVDVWDTWRRLDCLQLFRDIRSIPMHQYDLVISDFEPVSCWASRLKKVRCVGLSHQYAVIHPNAPKPAHDDLLGRQVLHHYAPVKEGFGFHFERYAPDIFTPVIRDEVRQLTPTTNGHYTVYLPAYNDSALLHFFSRFDTVQWEIFSKHNKTEIRQGNVLIRPVQNDLFLHSMASATGVLCGAGFETPAEALYLGKRLMVVPMKGQYEQHCNAAALEKLGVPVYRHIGNDAEATVANWLNHPQPITVQYPDETDALLDRIVHSI